MNRDAPIAQLNRWQRLLTNHFVSFLLWLISTGLLILNVIYGRVILMAIFGRGGINYWVLSFIDRAGILILGLIALCLSLFLEYYYRQSVAKQLLWPRFLRVAVIQLAIIGAGIAISWFAPAI